MDRYTVISADCHGGGAIADYRPYLPSHGPRRLRRVARPTFENPYDDLEGDDAGRNWDSDRRLAELEADGVVAEVIFPNTIPPFFPQASLVHQPPARRRRRPRAALGRACGPTTAGSPTSAPRHPGRRAGIAQILLARRRRRGRRDPLGGRGRAHRRRAAARRAARARACRRCTRPTTSRSGGVRGARPAGQPPHRQRVARLRRLPRGQGRCSSSRSRGGPTGRCGSSSSSGVMERHPTLQFVFTEQGTAWLPEQLATPRLLRRPHVAARPARRSTMFGADVMSRLSLKPSEYWARQCHVGSSFIRRHEVAAAPRGRRRPDHVGQRLPPPRGLLAVLPRAPAARVRRRARRRGARRWSAATRPRVYGFDLDALAPVAARVGPLVDEVARPLAADDIPAEALRCPAFALGRGTSR